MKILDYSPTLSRKKLKILYGTVTPCDWDKEDKPISFSLFTPQEEDILLKGDHLKSKFLKLMNKHVEVIGEERTNVFGEKYVLVKKIRRLNFPEFQLLYRNKLDNNYYELKEYAPSIAKSVLENIENQYTQHAI